MRVKHRVALLTITGVLVGVAACEENRVTTEPDAVTYVTTTSAAVVNPKTHQLEPVRSGLGAEASASTVAGSGSTPAMFVANNAPGVARTSGHIDYSYVDANGRAHKIILLYRTGGGPPAAMQDWVNAKLVSTTAYSWAKTTTGWYNSLSLTRVVSGSTTVGTYSLTGTYGTTTKPCNPKVTSNCGPQQTVRLDHPRVGPLQRAIGTFALGVAYACLPAKASAQFYFSACAVEWLHYAAADAVVSVLVGSIGSGDPMAFLALAGAMAELAADYDALVSCMVAHDGTASSGFGGAGAGAGGAAETNADCENGGIGSECLQAYVE